MKYLVMETHPAYAVVLDEGGRFLKAANLHYQVGETVDEVIELQAAPPRRRRWPLWGFVCALALAGCGLAAYAGWWQPNFAPYGVLRIRINPDVELTVSKTDRVLDARARNEAGAALLEKLELKGEDSDEAVEKLVEEAIEQGWLPEGGLVSIDAESEDDDWELREEAALGAQLRDEFGTYFALRLGALEDSREDWDAASSENRDPASSENRYAGREDWDDDDDDDDDDWDDWDEYD